MMENTRASIVALALAAGIVGLGVPAMAADAGVAPLPGGAAVAWSHAPYEMGECGLCHERDDPANPGPITAADITQLCYGCHEELEQAMSKARVAHAAVEDSCTNCHNPHNAAYKKLLIAESPDLCAQCHEEVWKEGTMAPVQHRAVQDGKGCLNCHSPHASEVDSLLNGLAYNLCIGCHGKDGVTDEQGRELTNFAALLKSNPVVHGPVAAEDCSACHTPHGGKIFRLLTTEYPAKFYSPFEPRNYELCFSCHNSEVVAVERTTTLTGFRDGDRNLHYVHVNKKDRGRTCRACHEVHAAPQEHLIRDGVPYGKSGWILKINYTRLPDGGRCEKTCHGAFTYDRKKTAEGGGAS